MSEIAAIGRGRPLHQPTDETRAEVKKLASCGAGQSLVARVLKVSEPTLRKHHRAELDEASEWANATVARSLFDKALGNGPGSIVAAIFWLKTRAGWKEKQPTGKGEGQIVVQITETELGSGR